MPNLQGLLGNPMFNMGVGLLGAGGRQQGPQQSTGQRFMQGVSSGNAMTQQFQQMQAQRDALSAQKRKQEAMAKITNLLNNPVANTPAAPNAVQQQQAQVQGLLSQAAPEEFLKQSISGLFSPQQQPKTSAKMNDWIAMGGNPQDIAGFQKFSNPSDPLQDAQLVKLMADMQNDMAIRRAEDEERYTKKETMKLGIESGVQDMVELYKINKRLENSPLQSGVPLGEMRRALSGGVKGISDFFNVDSSTAAALNADYDLFKKISTSFAVNSQDRLGSNFQLQSTMDANANLAAAPAANNYVIAANLRELLAQARARNTVLPNEFVRDAQKIIGEVFQTPPPAGFEEDK